MEALIINRRDQSYIYQRYLLPSIKWHINTFDKGLCISPIVFIIQQFCRCFIDLLQAFTVLKLDIQFELKILCYLVHFIN